MALSDQKRKIHFVGIGGIGMSGLAELLLGLGHYVSGSDVKESESLERLKSLGANVFIGHDEKHIAAEEPDAVVYTSAVKESNPELSYAMRNHIPIIRRAEMLAELMRLKRGVAVAGSHGKTTTTAMLGLILKYSNLDPTLVIGGRFDAIGSNAAWGAGDWLVAEADESDGSFLRLAPEYCVVTNIDNEHMDHYGTFEEALGAFEVFLDKIPFYGKAVLCSDSPALRSLGKKFNKPRVWYGFEKTTKPDFLIQAEEGVPFPSVQVYSKDSDFSELVLDFQLNIPGRHNILNAAGAALLAMELGVKPPAIREALKEFRGVRRRFEYKGEVRGVKIYEDYAHHPTEIEATLGAAASLFDGKKIGVVYQPHRYSRTQDCWQDFQKCFSKSSVLWSLPIYAASEPREEWTTKFDGENFFLNTKVKSGEYVEDINNIPSKVLEAIDNGKLAEGDVLFVLGAGDVYRCIGPLLENV